MKGEKRKLHSTRAGCRLVARLDPGTLMMDPELHLGGLRRDVDENHPAPIKVYEA